MCTGRCVIEDSNIRHTTDHNHPPEPDRISVDKFRKVLTQRAANETTELYTIYWEEASQRHADAALLYTFHTAESAMRKARRKQYPQAPNNSNELNDILANTKLFRIHSGARNGQFYQRTLSADDAICVLFMHERTLQAIGHIDELHMNNVTEIKLQSSNSYHLLIVHAMQMNHVCVTPVHLTVIYLADRSRHRRSRSFYPFTFSNGILKILSRRSFYFQLKRRCLERLFRQHKTTVNGR